jgi:hypothetical protein
VKVLNIIRTTSLAHDERVMKEAKNLIKCGMKDVDIYAIEEKRSSVNIPHINSYSVKSYKFVNKSSFFKLLYILLNYFNIELTYNKDSYDVIWLHEPILFFIIPLIRIGYSGKIVWDLHELPPPVFFKYKILREAFYYVSLKCDTIIVANEERGKYMLEMGLINDFKVLSNYPGKFNDVRISNYRDDEFEDWVNSKEFAYCQSPTKPSRNFFEIATACVRENQYLVVVGKKNNIYHDVQNRVKDFDKYIKVLGRKPSYSLSYYLSKAKFSIILYSNINRNNFYCAPNRLYHSIKEGVPVIVGANPTMSNIIKPAKAGVVLDGYGEEVEQISEAIRIMNKNYECFKKNIELISNDYRWENQEYIIKSIISK